MKNQHDGKQWNILFYQVNIDVLKEEVAPTSSHKVSKLNLRVGDNVSFESREGAEVFGTVVKLNPKTAGILVGNSNWRVHYSYLSIVFDGELGADLFLEGEVVDPE